MSLGRLYSGYYSPDEYRYKNGNYMVIGEIGYANKLYKRALRFNEELIPDFPDSIDLKINNVCNIGCPFCHESSVPDGKLADLNKLKKIITQLPRLPIEIALGGGDLIANEETIKHTLDIVNWLKNYGLLVRGTINAKSYIAKKDDKLVTELIDELNIIGLSVDNFNTYKKAKSIKVQLEGKSKLHYIYLEKSNVVFHVICGLFPSTDIIPILEATEFPVLFLGYKKWGRGKNYDCNEEEIKKTRDIIEKIVTGEIKINKRKTGITLGFDNLAIEQLNLQDMISPEMWETIYLGDDFSHSMYIDAVNGEYAKTSRSEERVSWNNVGLLEFFKNDKITN